MTDHSHLDAKYFIDNHVFNCPFCKRNNVEYSLDYKKSFNWSNDKECFIYFANCSSCGQKSMHLSFNDLDMYNPVGNKYRFNLDDYSELDNNFFYSVPTSFFALDERIPKVLRELFTEAEGCLKSNYLTGTSACARKIVYELAILEGAEGSNYEDRIKSLKDKRKDVEGEYFDTLLTIQQLTSDKVHEESYDSWESRHLNLILSTISEVLGMMYVIPAIRQEKRQSIIDLKKELVGDTQ